MIEFEKVEAYRLKNREGVKETWEIEEEWSGLIKLKRKGETIIAHKPGGKLSEVLNGITGVPLAGGLQVVSISPDAASRLIKHREPAPKKVVGHCVLSPNGELKYGTSHFVSKPQDVLRACKAFIAADETRRDFTIHKMVVGDKV